MHFESNTFQQFNPTAPHSEKCEDLNTGSVISIYKNATSFCIGGGCAKGVGSLSLCLGFSSETKESISQRHTRCFFVMQGLTHLLVQHRPLMVQIFFKSSGSDVQLLTFVSSLSLSLVTQLGESPFVNGKITHKIKVVPSANLTVHCTVTNRLGNDSRAINVSSCKYKVIIWSFYLCRLHFSFMKSLICLPKCFPIVLTNSFHLHVNLASCLHALTKRQYCSRYVHQGKSAQFGIVCSVCGVTSLHTNLVAIRAIS